jgi:DNA polymerase-3 subunit delta'
MSFQSIVGQELGKRMLQNGLRESKLSHAYIFNGPLGSGRREMAAALAQAVYCTELKDDACGQCLGCRKIEHNNHPDYYWVEPDGTSIKIDQIRELQKEFAYRSTASQTKIYVLYEADRMTVQAANSLLKFLEEPLSDVIAILITENGNALLPTIKSRSQWIPFVPAAPVEMARKLLDEGFPHALIAPAVRITAGIGAAKKLIESNWFAEARNVVIQLAQEMITRFPTALITVQQKVIKSELSEHLPTLLDLIILWLKDMVQLHIGRKENIVYIDQLEWMSAHATTYEISYWVHAIECTVNMQKRLRFHANAQLAFEKLLIDIKGG